MKYLLSLFLLSWTGMISLGQVCLQIDSSFGFRGSAIGSMNGFRMEDLRGNLFIQSDNKIIQLMQADNGVNSGIGLVRYHLNGEQDLSFGTKGSVITIVGNQFFAASSGVLQSDDKLIVAGSVYENGANFALVRYNKNGSLDDRFGNGGLAKIPVGPSYAYATGIALQPDGKIVVVGSSTDLQGIYSFTTVRFLQNGDIDTHFGNQGKIIAHVGPIVTNVNEPFNMQYANEFARNVLIQPGGKIIVFGVSYSLGNCYPDYYGGIYCSPGFTMARYHSNGILDTTFSKSGIFIDSVLTDYNSFPVLLSNDKILVAGSFGHDEVLIKQYTKNGLPDNGVGNDGLIRMKVEGSSINYPAYFVSFHQQMNGKNTLLWNSYQSVGNDILVSQFSINKPPQETGPGNSLRINFRDPFSYTEAGAMIVRENEILISAKIRNSVSTPFLIKLKEIVPKPFIIQDGNQLSTQPGYTTYHWFVNGMGVAGNNSNNFKPSQNGIIKVTVTNSDGCTNTSEEYNHLVLAAKDIYIGNTKLVYYPNPSHSILNIDVLDRADKKIKAELYEPGGKLVYHQNLNYLSNQISIWHLPAGVYQLRLKNGHESASAKIVLIK